MSCHRPANNGMHWTPMEMDSSAFANATAMYVYIHTHAVAAVQTHLDGKSRDDNRLTCMHVCFIATIV